MAAVTPWWLGRQVRCESYGRYNNEECYALAAIQLHGWWLCPACYNRALDAGRVFMAVALAMPPHNWPYDPSLDFSVDWPYCP